MSKKYTERQLSTILSEHDAGQLLRFGCFKWVDGLGRNPVGGCINQVAFNELSPLEAAHDRRMNPEAAYWFDRYYNRKWTPDELLHELEKHGWA